MTQKLLHDTKCKPYNLQVYHFRGREYLNK
jgi:hypothetical protein